MATEDLTGFTEVDGGGDLTVTASKVDVATQANNVNNYVHESKSIGTSDFDWDFEHNVTAVSGTYSTGWFVGCSTTTGTLENGFSIGCVFDSTSITPYLADYDDSVNVDASTAGSNLSLSTLYYSSLSRVGNTLTWDIYTDSGRTSLSQSISMTISNTTASYDEAYAESSYNWGDTSATTYFVQNLDYKEGGGGGRIMGSLAGVGGLAGAGGIAGIGGGLAG